MSGDGSARAAFTDHAHRPLHSWITRVAHSVERVDGRLAHDGGGGGGGGEARLNSGPRNSPTGFLTRPFPRRSNNWGLVGAAGDLMRTQLIARFGNTSWSDAMMKFQFSPPDVYTQITPNGLYQDHSGAGGLNPLPYDTFPTSGYLTVLLKEGYNGTFAPFLRELTRRAALSHLLMQSPWGEIPTGGRSSQHQWNEAVSALAYEIAASDAQARGDGALACVFKRAAHLSLESVARWQRTSGPYKGSLSIIKNRFDPSLRWGYEGYSFLTNYNNLPAAMLAAAHMCAFYAHHAFPPARNCNPTDPNSPRAPRP